MDIFKSTMTKSPVADFDLIVSQEKAESHSRKKPRKQKQKFVKIIA